MARLKGLSDNQAVTVAGVVLVRQRPGSAQGVVFVTLEDEFSIANIVVWPKTLETFRAAVMGARLMLIKGRVQQSGDIIHVIAYSIEDRSEWLQRLSADEALRQSAGPGRRGDARRPRWLTRTAGRPSRHQRIIPKSRDFH